LPKIIALGFDFEEIVGVIPALMSADFYKSMTTYTDYRVWQDVGSIVPPIC